MTVIRGNNAQNITAVGNILVSRNMTINGCCTGRAALDVGGLVLVTPNYANVFTVNGNTSVQDVLLVGSDIGGTSLKVTGTASMTGLTTSGGLVFCTPSSNTLTTSSNIVFDDALAILTVDGSSGGHIARQLQYINSFGNTVVKGQPVYITADHGQSGIISGYLANCSLSTKMPAIGLASTGYTSGLSGYVACSGLITGLVSSSVFDVAPGNSDTGKHVYVAPGTGKLTLNRPQNPNDFVQTIGLLTKRNGGSVDILIQGPGQTNDVPNSINVHNENIHTTLSVGKDAPVTSTNLYVTGNVYISNALRVDNILVVDTANANAVTITGNVAIGADVFISDTASNVLQVTGNISATRGLYVGSNLQVSDTASNVLQVTGNLRTTRGLYVGSNLQVSDTASNVLTVTGNILATNIASFSTGAISLITPVSFTEQLTLPTTRPTATFSSPTLTCNFNSKSTGIFSGTLNGNMTAIDFTNGRIGGQYVIYITATGDTRTIGFTLAGTTNKTNYTSVISVGTSSVALLTITYDGTSYLIAGSAYN